MFTQETKLLIEHWPAVEEIIQAQRELQTQLTRFLLSLEGDLAKEDWWSDNWEFIKQDDDGVYISHNNWRRNKTEYAIWIGVEGFGASELFGKVGFSQLYVWSKTYDKPFLTGLRELFKAKKPLGSVEETNSNYIIKHSLPKILPNQSSEFESLVRNPIVKFFSFYAKEEKAISEIFARQFKST
jgi:hypothetical protein